MNPADEAPLKVFGTKQGEHPVEGVMGSYPMGQLEKRLEPIMFGLGVVHDFHPVVGTADDRANNIDNDVNEPVASLQLNPRVLE